MTTIPLIVGGNRRAEGGGPVLKGIYLASRLSPLFRFMSLYLKMWRRANNDDLIRNKYKLMIFEAVHNYLSCQLYIFPYKSIVMMYWSKHYCIFCTAILQCYSDNQKTTE